MDRSSSALMLCWVFVLGLLSACETERSTPSEPPEPAAPARRSERAAEAERKPSVQASDPVGMPEPEAAEPEHLPHHAYPTLLEAGTADLFVLEEPDRGPRAKPVTLPDTARLARAVHRHCELTAGGLACGKQLKDASRARWEVFRAGGRPVLARSLPGAKNVVQTVVLDWTAEGALQQATLLDAYGEVDEARFYRPSGARYSARRLNGANALSGCGFMALESQATATVTTCLQWSGKPMRDTHGVVKTVSKLDPSGFAIEVARFDLLDNAVNDHDGVHRTVIARDADGRPVTQLTFDRRGDPALSKGTGCFGQRFEYGATGLLERETCLGADGAPIDDSEGVATTVQRYDASGCLIDQRLLDKAGASASRRGVHRWTWVQNAHCRATRQACSDINDLSVRCGLGDPAATAWAYDARGRLIDARSYDSDGSAGSDPECDAFELRYEVDDVGNTTATASFDRAGDPVECSGTGYHKSVGRFDDAGRETDKVFFGTDGEPATNLGTARRRFSYDAYDHEVGADELDANGVLVPSTLGLARSQQLYEPGHRMFALLLWDKDGQAARYAGCFTGVSCPTVPWHAVRVERGEDGKVQANLFFDADRQLVATHDCQKVRCWE